MMQSFEIAAETAWRRHKPTPGQKFIFKLSRDRRMKDHARARLYWRLSNWYRPLTILTLPSIHWELERQLISSRRENRRKVEILSQEIPRVLTTTFVSFEHDPALWRAALQKIPRNCEGIRVTNGRAVATSSVRHFECGDVEDGILGGRASGVDAAWLDFAGMLTDRRIEAMRRLWAQPEMRFLAVTSLRARWAKDVGAAIADAGGIGGFLKAVLPSSKLVDDFDYHDVGGAPMNQSVLIKQCAERAS